MGGVLSDRLVLLQKDTWWEVRVQLLIVSALLLEKGPEAHVRTHGACACACACVCGVCVVWLTARCVHLQVSLLGAALPLVWAGNEPFLYVGRLVPCP